jgi:taurine-pyruvate aminotransferase
MLVTEADGSTIVDSDGKRYLDGYAGIWNVNVGYGRQEIVDAVTAQMSRLPFYPQTQINEPAARLAARLAELMPGDLNHVFFVNSGSEANETALKAARQCQRQRHPGENRYKVIARYQGYHGFTMGALSATGQVDRRHQYEPLVPGFIHVEPPPTHGPEDIARVIERESPDTVAAVIAEPVIGGGGVLVPPDDYFPKLREVCDRYGVLLILDEVITGFGRTGKLFACEHWGVVPDMMSVAKGLSSGYLPIGACVVSDAVFEAFLGAPEDAVEFSQVATYGGHPACAAAALASLDIMTRERLWENSEKVGAYLMARLQAIDSPYIREVRGKGLMIAIELQDENGDMLDAPRSAAFGRAVREAGVIMGKMSHAVRGPEAVYYLSPPLILTEEESDTIGNAVVTGLRAIS